jgi:hypothetical protein
MCDAMGVEQIPWKGSLVMFDFEHCFDRKVFGDESPMRMSVLALLILVLTILCIGCSGGQEAGEATTTTQAPLQTQSAAPQETNGSTLNAAASPGNPVAAVSNAVRVPDAGSTVPFASGSPDAAAGPGFPLALVANPVNVGIGDGTSLDAGSTLTPESLSSAAAAGASLEEWHKTIQNVAKPNAGCFTAEYPSTRWVEVPCVTPPNTPSHVPRDRVASGSAENVGNGSDWVIQAPANTTITNSTGSFPGISVNSEADFSPNSFSLQLNTNTFGGTTSEQPAPQLTALCNQGTNASGCEGWEQFVYGTTQSDSAEGVSAYSQAFIQYWLLGYNPTSTKPCPKGPSPLGQWNTSGSNCWINNPKGVAVTAGPEPITNLGTLALSGYATSASDELYLYAGGQAFSFTTTTSILGLSKDWQQAEFNVFGVNSGTEACFNSGSSITVETEIWTNPSTTSGATYAANGTTGETNNLNETSSPTLLNNIDAIEFTENSAQLCEPALGTYWPVAYQSNANSLNILSTSAVTMGNFVNFNEGLGMLTETVPSLVMLASTNLEIAFTANTGLLWLEQTTPNGGTILSEGSQNLAVRGGTSPSIATTWNTGSAPEGIDGVGLVGYQTSNGDAIIAFQGSNGDLWLEVNGTGYDQGLAMATGTSPSIGVFPGQSATAYQSNSNSLIILQSGYSYNLGLAMATGTSPSLAITPSGGYDVVYQSSTNQLFFVQVTTPPPIGGTLNFTVTNEGLAMQAGTSPSLTILPNGTTGTPKWAFQANTGSLYVQSTNQNLGMASAASPTILPTPFGYQVAFEANTDVLWLDVNGVGINMGLSMNTP